jgi:hypothetical protein
MRHIIICTSIHQIQSSFVFGNLPISTGVNEIIMPQKFTKPTSEGEEPENWSGAVIIVAFFTNKK